MVGMGSVFFIIAALMQGIEQIEAELCLVVKSPSYIGSIIYLVIFSSVIAFYMLNYAVNYLPVSKATSFTNLTAVVSMIAGVVFLNEKTDTIHYVGCVFVILGVYIANRFGVDKNI